MVQQLALTGTAYLWRIDDGWDNPTEILTRLPGPAGTRRCLRGPRKYPSGVLPEGSIFRPPAIGFPGISGSRGGRCYDACNGLQATITPPI